MRAVDRMAPDFGITAITAPAWLLRYAKGDDMSSMLGGIKTFGTHYAAVVHGTISIQRMSKYAKRGSL